MYDREDRIVLTLADQTMKWYRKGKLHCDDDPTIVWTDSKKEWFKNRQPFFSW